jgi:hypothetical protein
VRKFILFTLLSLVSAFGAANSAIAQDIRVDGIGAQRCGAVVSAYEANPATIGNSMVSWAYGYMTRRNLERTASGLNPINLQPAGLGPSNMMKLLIGVCERQPNAHFVLAVDALFDYLRTNYTS